MCTLVESFKIIRLQARFVYDMVTISSAISTLLIGNGTFLVSRISADSWVFGVETALLFIGVISSALAIIFYFLSLKVRDFKTIFDAKDFINIPEQDKRCKTYLESNYPLSEEAEQMKVKAMWLRYGQWFFFGSIVMVSAALVSVLFAVVSGQTSFLGGALPGTNQTKLPANQPPIAEATFNHSTNGSLIILNASASRDPDGNITSFHWKQKLGNPVNITGADKPVASFAIPTNMTSGSMLGFSSSVKDNKNSTAAANITLDLLPTTVGSRPRFIMGCIAVRCW